MGPWTGKLIVFFNWSKIEALLSPDTPRTEAELC